MKTIFAFIFCLFHLVGLATDSTKIEIYFPFNNYQLTTNATASLDSVITTFNTNAKMLTSIAIVGHTDQIGNHNYNNNLSLKRANSTAQYLVQNGIDSHLINSIIGFGKTQLITTSSKEQDRYFNRRVVIIFYFKNKINQNPIVIPKDSIQEKPIIAKPLPPQKIADKLSDSSLKIGDKLELPYILFIGGMHEFLPISYPYLDQLFFALKNNSNIEIEIQGHICCILNKADGEDWATGRHNLSVARAKAVYDFLVKSGIDASRLSYKGFGHQFPITEERDEQEKTRNRRVEIKILKK